MKALGIIAAAVAGFFAAPASATTYAPPVAPTAIVDTGATGLVQRYRYEDRRGYRYDRRHYNDRRRYAWRWRTDCRREWRRGHRERVCHRIRYRHYYR